MSFSTHNQFQLGLPNKQPSFLSISRVSALVGTDGDDLDDRVAATGSSQPPTFTGESLRGLFKNTLPATNLATIGGVGVSRNPTVQNASERRISIGGFFDFFNRTGIRPTTNTDRDDPKQIRTPDRNRRFTTTRNRRRNSNQTHAWRRIDNLVRLVVTGR